METNPDELTDAQRETIRQSGIEAPKVISVNVSSGGETISDYQGGSGRISIADKTGDGVDPDYMHVLFLNTNGNTERMPTTHTGISCSVLVKHTSDYILVYDETDLNENVPPISGAEVEPLVYDGTVQSVKVSAVKAGAVQLKNSILPPDAYTVSGDVKAKKAGTYTLTITAKEGSGYRGSVKVNWEVKKADQNLTLTPKNVKVKQGTKRIKAKKALKVSGAGLINLVFIFYCFNMVNY